MRPGFHTESFRPLFQCAVTREGATDVDSSGCAEEERERESAGGCEQIDWPFQEFCDSVATEKWIMQCLSLNSQLVNIAHGRNATYLPEVSQTLLPTLPTYSGTQNLFTAPSAAAL